MLHLLPSPVAPPRDLRELGVTLRAARSAAAHARTAAVRDPAQAARDLAYVAAATAAARAFAPAPVAEALDTSLDAALATLGALLDPFAPGGWTPACGDRCSILEVADVVRSARAAGVRVRLEADWLALADVPSAVAQRARQEVSDGIAAQRRGRAGATLTVTLHPAGHDVVVAVAARAEDRERRITRAVAA